MGIDEGGIIMSKELEALNDLRNSGLVKDYNVVCFNKEALEKRLDIIETALIEKENIEKSITELFSGKNGKVITTFDIQKKLKALEIIKSVCPNIFWVMRTTTYKEYKRKCSDDTLLEEEYDLLKEVLL